MTDLSHWLGGGGGPTANQGIFTFASLSRGSNYEMGFVTTRGQQKQILTHPQHTIAWRGATLFAGFQGFNCVQIYRGPKVVCSLKKKL
jgi:hypothetical protein